MFYLEYFAKVIHTHVAHRFSKMSLSNSVTQRELNVFFSHIYHTLATGRLFRAYRQTNRAYQFARLVIYHFITVVKRERETKANQSTPA